MYPTSFANLFLRLSHINDKWNEFITRFSVLKYKKGRIIRTGAEHILFLEKGIIRASYITYTGLEWIFLFQKEGCLFNELSLLKAVSKFQFTAHTDVSVKLIPIKLLQSDEFIRDFPELYINLIETLALKESINYSYFADLAFASSKSRVCQALLALFKDHESLEFCPELTQTEIGQMMGLHQTTVARVIKELRKEKIIGVFTKKKLQILDIEKLREISKKEYETLNQCLPN